MPAPCAATRRRFSAEGSRPDELLVDTCGTGGDASGTFNISTAAAFVAAGAGVRVAKHGNRSISSKCGSADVLEALGVSLDIPPERVGEAIREIGIGFLFAPAMHTAMRHAMPARRRLGRTAFNLLGPLTNPAGAPRASRRRLFRQVVEKVALAAQRTGVERAFVVHGAGGLDEISLAGETTVGDVHRDVVRLYQVTPEDFGLERAPLSKRSPAETPRTTPASSAPSSPASAARAATSSSPTPPPRLSPSGRAADFLEGAQLAAESIDSGAAHKKLEALIAFTGK